MSEDLVTSLTPEHPDIEKSVLRKNKNSTFRGKE